LGGALAAKRDSKRESLSLFSLDAPVKREPLIRRLRYPIWTEKKAKLIEEYLFLFVQITHHGTYIDGFTGPQDSDKPHTWAAKLVLERAPRWFRHFFLFETDKRKVELIKQMVALQPPRDKKKKEPVRTIEVSPSDCNKGIVELLSSHRIGQKEATFCLLD
jgi:three-Cys-motif partner protein